MKYLRLFAVAIVFASFAGCSGSDNSKTEPGADAKDGDAEKVIPGIAASDIHINYTNKGFTLDKNIGADASTWICHSAENGKDYTVKIFGKTPSKIDRVDATVMFDKADDEARQFIGYSASIPYTGSNGPAATAWAISRFDKGGDTTIGNVKFYLVAAREGARVLKLNAH